MSMRSEVVVITGASAGVGRATVQEFARRGARIALLAREPQRLEAARREALALGARAAIAIPVDVADAAAVEAAATAIERKLGSIDVWINNAMASVFSPVHQMTTAEFDRVTAVTYLGTVYGTLAALLRMRARDRGTIVQVGSALAYRSIPLQAAYCAAKHAVLGFTEALRTELLHDRSRVHVCMVQMPALNTPQFDWVKSRLPRRAQPVPPIFQPEVAARAIYWAAHHRRREVYVGGSTLKAIWAEKLVPSLADRYLARNGFEAQQTAEPADPGRPDNLWQPVPGEFGAHGRFDARALARSRQLWLTTHRERLLLGALAGAGVLFALARLARHARADASEREAA